VKQDFRGTKWSNLSWQPIVKADQFKDLATGDSSAVKRGDTQLAIFKIRGKYYCTQQMCPHKRAFVLSDGLIGDDIKTNKMWVSCPYHKRNYELSGPDAGKCGNDDEVNIATFPVEERDDGWVYVKLPPVEELDSVLGTEKWKIKKEEGVADPFIKLDKKLKAMKGRKGQQASHFENGKGEKATAENILAGNGVDPPNTLDW
jgi:nitrite reductase (NAD(P)H)